MKKKEIKNNLLSITKYLVEKYKIIQPVKLQKILYFLYLDYLKENNEKLFDEEFEAIYGPVVTKVFYHIKYHGFNFEIEEDDTLFEICSLNNDKIKKFIDKKIDKYLNKSTFDLVEIAHNTKPWQNARKYLKDNEISNNNINFNDMKDFSKIWNI
ncbi:Panacea domain-containing protein [Spiroplasma endosymbiont of Dactylopius coccus]